MHGQYTGSLGQIYLSLFVARLFIKSRSLTSSNLRSRILSDLLFCRLCLFLGEQDEIFMQSFECITLCEALSTRLRL